MASHTIKIATATTMLVCMQSGISLAQMQFVDQPKNAVIEDQRQEITIFDPTSLKPLRLDKTLSDTLLKNGIRIEPTPQPETSVTLDIIERQSRIWNPNTGRFDAVLLRAYQKHGDPTAMDLPYVAPVLSAIPGQTVRLGLNNLLPLEPECAEHTPENMNEPDAHKCRNVTNNHFHGGWVNPNGISDNVLRLLKPNPNFTYEYEYNIPADHPAGTFWYHPHVHGSTAIQVASGMAGALIIRGNRVPQELPANEYKPGDVDVLLKEDNVSIPDKVFVLQQIQYACRKGADGSDRPGTAKWSCDPGVVGKLDGYDLFLDRTVTPPQTQWQPSGRFTTVNGVVSATLRETVTAGKPERWRFIHGGFADSIRLQIFKRKKPEMQVAGVPGIFEATSAAKQDEIIQRECDVDGNAEPLFEIAADGLTRNAVLESNQRILHPGYRSDLLVVFREPGEYCVLDMALPPNAGVPGTLDTRRLLFTVTVTGSSLAGTAQEAILKLLTDAATNLPSVTDAIRQRILDDLRAGLQLTLFAPHKTLVNEPKSNDVTGVFTLRSGKTRHSETKLGTPFGAAFMAIKGAKPPPDLVRFSGKPMDVLELTLGDVDEWTVSVIDGEPVGHPFHIHVNPFEIMSVIHKDGRDLTQDPNSQYYRMTGVWKDTVFVEPDVVVKFRTKYQRYTGDFVMHCHILYHEDEGMMQRVSIVDPGTEQAHSAHHQQ